LTIFTFIADDMVNSGQRYLRIVFKQTNASLKS